MGSDLYLAYRDNPSFYPKAKSAELKSEVVIRRYVITNEDLTIDFGIDGDITTVMLQGDSKNRFLLIETTTTLTEAR